MDSAAPKRLAREAERSKPFRWLAQSGYGASGLVHLLIGIIALVVALGGYGRTDQSGALMAIATAPAGFVVLWIVATALWALALWQLLEGVLVPSGSADAVGWARTWGRRVGAWGQAVVFAALGAIAAAVALGARVDTEQAAKDVSRLLLELPGGPILLTLAGAGIGITGVSFVVMGLRRSFRNKMAIPRHGVGPAVAALGVFGFVSKGIALLIVGILLVIAAVRMDWRTAGGLHGAIDSLLGLLYGPFLVGIVGLGFVSYGVFCFFRARLATF